MFDRIGCYPFGVDDKQAENGHFSYTRAMRRFKRYLLAVSMAANQLVNALTGGDPDMSVSARAGYAREAGSKVGSATCHVLNWFDWNDGDDPQQEHCVVAVRNHEMRSGKK